MRVRSAVAVAMLVTGCHGWTARDTALELAAQASLAADYAQSEQATSMPAFAEKNSLIRATSPAFYFATAAVLHVTLAAILPRSWLRSGFQATTIGWELGVVSKNFAVMHAASR